MQDIPTAEAKRELVRSQLEDYKRLYRQYNRTLTHIRTDDLDQALTEYLELISFQDRLPLPALFYKGYLLVLLGLGRHDQADSILKNAPRYVQLNPEIKAVSEKFGLHVGNERHKPAQNRKWTRSVMAQVAAVVLALMIGGGVGSLLNTDAQPATIEAFLAVH